MTHIPLNEAIRKIPRQVRETRERRGLTIQGAAKAIGIPRGALKRIEDSDNANTHTAAGAITIEQLALTAAWLD